jgi:hypothetical protein
VPRTIARSYWTHTPAPVSALIGMTDVRGIVLHWVHDEMSDTLPDDAPSTQVAKIIEGIRIMHVDTLGFSDIGYNAVIDQRGHIWLARPMWARPGVNETAIGNNRYLAVLLMIGQGQKPSPQMIESVREYRARVIRMNPHAGEVLGHNALADVECPGDATMKMIKNDTFNPAPGGGPDPARPRTRRRDGGTDDTVVHLGKALDHVERAISAYRATDTLHPISAELVGDPTTAEAIAKALADELATRGMLIKINTDDPPDAA